VAGFAVVVAVVAVVSEVVVAVLSEVDVSVSVAQHWSLRQARLDNRNLN
jgi:hypothetical protein